MQRGWTAGKSIAVGVVLCALLLPLMVRDQYWQHLLVMTGMWIISASALNLLLGGAGQLNLAHGTFFGVGAYATALLIQKAGFPFWAALPAGSLITAALGIITGLPTLRTKGHYFPIATMCLGIAIYYVIARWDNFTGGACGIFGIPRPEPLPIPFFGAISFESTIACYYLVMFFTVVSVGIIAAILKFVSGYRLIAIRGNETLAQSIGINTMREKVICFSISTFFAGLAGGLYAGYMGTLMAEQAHFLLSFDMLLYVIIGGIGTIAGPICGAMLVFYMAEALHALDEFRLIIFGVILILCLRFMPFGLMGALRTLLQQYKTNKSIE
jgi:branched-chain amino acid transport system permease protein